MIWSQENVKQNQAYVQSSDIYFSLLEACLYDRTTIVWYGVHHILLAPAIIGDKVFGVIPLGLHFDQVVSVDISLSIGEGKCLSLSFPYFSAGTYIFVFGFR